MSARDNQDDEGCARGYFKLNLWISAYVNTLNGREVTKKNDGPLTVKGIIEELKNYGKELLTDVDPTKSKRGVVLVHAHLLLNSLVANGKEKELEEQLALFLQIVREKKWEDIFQ